MQRHGTTGAPAQALRACLVLAVTAAAAVGALRIEPTVDFVDTVPDHPGLGPYRDLLDELDGVRFVALYVPHAAGPDLRTDPGFDALVAYQADLQAHLDGRHGITHFLSVHESVRGAHHLFWVVATGGNPPSGTHSVPDEPLYSQLRGRARDASGDVLAQDGSSALVLAFLPEAPQADLRDAAHAIGADARAWHEAHGQATATRLGTPAATGLLVTSHATDTRTASDLVFWGTVSAAAVALVLVAATRRPLAAVTAAASLGVALTWTFGILGWTGAPVSFLTVFLAPVVAGIGIDHALHLLHAHQAAKRAGDGRPMRTALASLGSPMILATTTTIGVLLLLGTVQAPMFAQVGRVAALGVALGLVAAVTVVPLAAGALSAPAGDRVGSRLARLHQKVHARKVPVLLATVLLVATAAAFASQARIESGSAENEFPQDDPHIVLQHRIQQEYGAFERAYIVVQGDIATPRVLAALDRGGQMARDLPLYRSASTVNDLLRAQAATDEGMLDVVGAGQGDAPRTPEEVRRALRDLQGDPFWGTLSPFVVSDGLRLTVIAIQLHPWPDQEQMVDLRDGLVELAERVQALAGPEVHVAAAGAPVNRAAVVDTIAADVAWVAGGGTVVVLAVLAAAWIPRRGLEGLRAALVGAGISVVCAIVLLGAVTVLDAYYQASGATHNAALSHMFLLAFAIAVGLGVDDHVHLVHAAWRAPRGSEPMTHAWKTVGRSVTATTATTIAAFLPLSGSYFLQSKNLAILVCIGVVTGWGASFVLSHWGVGHPTGAIEATGHTQEDAVAS